MQYHGPSGVLHNSKEIRGYLNSPGLAIVQVGTIGLYCRTPEECDWLITAACSAKQALLDEAAETVPWPTGFCGHPVEPGAFKRGFTRCRDCQHPDNRDGYDRAAAAEPVTAGSAA